MKRIYKIIPLLIIMVLFEACGKQKAIEEPTGEIHISNENTYVVKGMDEDILPEQYYEEGEKVLYVYYMNTDSICESDFLPVYIIQTLTEKTQDFLESQGYYELSSLTVIDNSKGQKSSVAYFQATMDGTDKILTVEYSFVTTELTFSIN